MRSNKHTVFDLRCWIGGLCFFVLLPSYQAETDGCGLRGTTAVNTVLDGEAENGGWPWQVSIQYRRTHVCSGVLVDSNWIVTAAHCVHEFTKSETTVLVGALNPSDTQNGNHHRVSDIIPHPEFKQASYKRSGYDISLVQLADPVIYSDTVRPVCISPGYGVPSTPCYTTGWNSQSIPGSGTLHQMHTPILDWTPCVDASGNDYNVYLHVCARSEAQQSDSCNVEGGSPIVCKRQWWSNQYDLWGIASWETDCQNSLVYTLFVTLKPWIEETMHIYNQRTPAVRSSPTPPRTTTSTSTPSTTTQSSTTSTTSPTTTKPSTTSTTSPTTTKPSTTTTTSPSTTKRTTTTTPTTPTKSRSTETTSLPTVTSATTSSSTSSTAASIYQCGQRIVSHIVGGEGAQPHSWPWMVSIQDKGNSSHLCGGAIISDRWILTAAHCLHLKRESSIQVEVGVHNIQYHDGYRINIEGTYMHRHFGPFPSLDNDIALIKLNQPLRFNERINAVCLPQTQNDDPTGVCYSTGWGFTQEAGPVASTLQQLVSPLQNASTCIMYNQRFQSGNRICSGTMNAGTCSGDSGGPLVCPSRGRYEVIGITSFGLGTCTDLTGNAKVSSYLPWIEQQTNVRCGQRFVPRIIGGREAPPHSWPWMASIEFSDGYYFCSGVLIAPRWVLTAGHCVYRRSETHIKVRLGVHNLVSDKGYSVNVKKIHMHPSHLTGHNIALLELTSPQTFDQEVTPVCLPSSRTPTRSCFTTSWGLTSLGGGVSDSLQQLQTPVHNDTTCSRSLRYIYRSPQMLCAGTQTTGTCSGDSGAPLVCPYRGRYAVQGIVSFGPGSCRGFTGYARVLHYMDWITEKITPRT